MKKLLLILALPWAALAAPDDQFVQDWIKAQAGVHSWTADFKQTRELKALTEPLTATGKIWFMAPDNFRWEVMKPAPTIAARVKDDLLVVFPRLKRAEKYSLASLRKGQWKDLMGLLDTGFPHSREEFEERFHVRDVVDIPGGRRLVLDPKSALVKKYLPEISIDVRTPDLTLLATTMTFIDGSVLKNEFTNTQLNPPLDAAVFTPSVEGYKVTQPLAEAP
ncbi:MAG TPA: outer membrane lipoprotein carrier protein LolA [Verrucomicrobiae bacterium]|jgi:outer membrane lipoprotein-sorting protein|nr:outer membrane lipoprotein carrier protein LolA [Verrucomicrobiae bacterium]